MQTVTSSPCARLAGLLLAMQISCGKENPRETPQMDQTDTKLNNRHSGYRGTVADWRRFLSCWYRGWFRESKNPEWDVHFQLVKRDVLGDGVDLSKTEGSYRARISARERALGMALPRSYVDFLLAYQPEESYRREGDGSHSFTRFVSVDMLEIVGAAQPEYAAGMEAASGEFTTPDGEYFIYGAKQDLLSTRPAYLRASLLIGHHGFDSSEVLALHPQVLTSDGEMEAEKYTFANSFRAPNFAELIRQTYRLQVLHWTLPRPESEMRTTCAGLLPMDAWWE